MRCRACVNWETWPLGPGVGLRVTMLKWAQNIPRGELWHLINFRISEILFKAVRSMTWGHLVTIISQVATSRKIRRRRIILRNARWNCDRGQWGVCEGQTPGIIYNALSNNKFRESFSSFEAFYIWPVNYSDKCLDIDLLPCWKKVNTKHFFT